MAEFWESSSLDGSSTTLKRGEATAADDELELSWSWSSRVSTKSDCEARVYCALMTFPPVSANCCYSGTVVRDVSESPEQSETFRFV